MQTTPHPGTHFLMLKISAKLKRSHPQMEAPNVSGDS